MQKRLTKYSDKDKPNWEWTQVQCIFKINQSSKKSAAWNLAPSITLTNPSAQDSDPNVRLYIDTEKSLQYSPQLGWNWHKSWNLPNISLRLQIKDENSGEVLLAPKNLYAQIFAVKKSSENQRNDHIILIDVGIRGDGKIQMIDGQVYFSAMKFSSTTYNNQGMNFNLLVVIYINEDINEKPKILTAVISPGIFVDSRRSARDYQEKKFNSFIEPFLYQNLEKQYIKRQNKSKTQSQILIKNDPQGFYNYLTAPNIRHKVKHPIFLAIKFSNCVKIAYNTESLENLGTKYFIQNLQKKLLKENKNKQKNQNGFLSNPSEKTFIFLVQNLNDSLKKKKIMQSIETMQNSAIGIIYDKAQLIGPFENIGDEESLTKAYRQSYENLLEQCKKYEPSDSESESSEQDGDLPSAKSVKRIKQNEVPAKTTRSSNNTNINKKTSNVSINDNFYEQSILKKQQQDNHLQEPKFFPPILSEIGSKKGSAFNKAVGFRTISPQNNEESENKNHDNLNMPFKSKSSTQNLKINNPISINHDSNHGMPSQMEGKNIQSMLCNNLMLSNWLSSVKNNNVNLYDTMTGSNLAETLLGQSLDRFGGPRNEQKGPENFQINEQLQCLVQQVNLYRQLLAQITYQNALLGRVFPPNPNTSSSQQPHMNYPPEFLHTIASTMTGLGLFGGLGLGQLSGLGGLGLLGGLNLNSLQASSNISQCFGGQNGLGGLLPNLPNLQNLQTLQTLSSLSNMCGYPAGLPNGMLGSGLGGNQASGLTLNEILRSSFENRGNQQQKRNKQDNK